MANTNTQTKRDNIIRAVRFERPDYIPMVFHINESSWHHYPKGSLEELMADHKFLFPDYQSGSGRAELDYVIPERVCAPFTDGWGCKWETAVNGIVGTVTNHPLADWSAFDTYTPPNPDTDTGKGEVDWTQTAADITAAKEAGSFITGGLRHGHTFMQLCDIRGYENLLFDMYDDHPKLHQLIEMVEHFNAAIVKHYIDIGVDMMTYAEDLGMQNGPMISPDMFEKYIKPSYKRLIKPAIDAGCIIHMHSDGHIRDLADHLIEGGVAALNLQDLVNGIDWIAEHLKGKVCIDLDIDRQSVTRFGTPSEIDDLIRKEVETLGSPSGGLMMIYGLYPGVPLENVQALMDAMERYSTYYS